MYWTLGGPRSTEVRRELGDGCRWVLRVLDLSEGTSREIPVDPKTGNYYVGVTPGHPYGFELAARAGGKWRTVCSTPRVEIPSGGRAPETEKHPPGVQKLRPPDPDRAVPGLRYETTASFLAFSPGAMEEDNGEGDN